MEEKGKRTIDGIPSRLRSFYIDSHVLLSLLLFLPPSYIQLIDQNGGYHMD